MSKSGRGVQSGVVIFSGLEKREIAHEEERETDLTSLLSSVIFDLPDLGISNIFTKFLNILIRFIFKLMIYYHNFWSEYHYANFYQRELIDESKFRNFR